MWKVFMTETKRINAIRARRHTEEGIEYRDTCEWYTRRKHCVLVITRRFGEISEKSLRNKESLFVLDWCIRECGYAATEDGGISNGDVRVM